MLQELGFDSCGALMLPEMVPNAVAAIELFANRTNNDVATVACVCGLLKGLVIRSVHYVEFTSRFRDFAVPQLQANNAGVPGGFPDTATVLTFRFPTIKNIEQLYDLHLGLVECKAPHLKPFLRIDEEFFGDQVAFLETGIRESFQWQADRGWLYYDASGRRWRPTAWSALRMTSQELFPVKQLRIMRLYMRGRRQLVELGYRDSTFMNDRRRPSRR